MTILEIKNLTHSFTGSKKILDNVSLSLKKGNIYALMGANGSGKTTLFNIINGFIKSASGDIFFNSKRITHQEPHKINRIGIGRTFQDLRLISKLTVRENVILAMKNNPTQDWFRALLPAYVYKSKLQELETEAEEIMATYFISDIRDSLGREISFGQQKLLNLACCVANGAGLFLLDEPVAGISPAYRERMVGLLKALKIAGRTILMIEHNPDFVAETGDRFLFLTNGEILEYNRFTELKSSNVAVDAYF